MRALFHFCRFLRRCGFSPGHLLVWATIILVIIAAVGR